jgi:hypothetical protein
MRNLAERLRSHYVEGMTLQAMLTAQKVNVEITPVGLQGLMALLGASQDKGFARAKREVNGTTYRGRSQRLSSNGKRNTWPSWTPKLQKIRAKGWQEVKSGKRPRIRDAVALVLADAATDMSLRDIVSSLQKRKWMAVTANPMSYVCRTIAINPEMFERVAKGTYRLKKGYQPPPFTGKPLQRESQTKRTPAPRSQGLRRAILELLPEEPAFLRGSVVAVKLKRPFENVRAMLKVLEGEGLLRMNRHKDHLVWSRKSS